ncbi:hypothetical protein APSETT445_003881 [Aspergillus pseudonomiae]
MSNAHRSSTGMARSTSPPAQQTPAIDQGPAGMPSLDGVEEAEVLVPMTQTVAIITSITCITGIGNLLAGLLTRVSGPGTVGNSKQRGWWSAGEGILARLHRDIDWVGALLISACLALLSYELAVATGSDADQRYWRGVFQAMALNPVGADLIYTIANLVMTDSFPVKTQELAGVFFNMLAQVGKGVGIATSTLIARQITSQTPSCRKCKRLFKRIQGRMVGQLCIGVCLCSCELLGTEERRAA